MTSRILGQVRESLLAYYFDKRITDAYAAAFRLPNLFRRLLGEGSLSASFIPVFVEAQLDQQKRAQNLVNSFYTFLLLVLGVLLTLGFLFPQQILSLLLDASYVADTEKFQLTVRLAQIMFGFLFFVSSYAFMMGVLNALGSYALPAVAPTFFNLSMIIFSVMPSEWFTIHGDQLAIGVLVGGCVQAGILVPALWRSGYLPKLSVDLRSDDFRRVLKSLGPGFLGLGLLQFTTLINLKFSSSLPEGTISYINYVDRLIELPLSLVSVSLGAALLPALSQMNARGLKDDFSAISRRYLELNLLMTMAAAGGLFTLAHPIVKMLFGHGRFSAESVEATTLILKTYCWIMIFSSAVRVLTPAYYAVKNTWFPALSSCICLFVHILLAPQLMKAFQVQGLMMSTIFSALLNCFLLLSFYRRYVGVFEFGKFFSNMLKYIFLAVLTMLAAHIFDVFENFAESGFVGLVLSTAFSILFAVFVFVAVGLLLKIEAVSEAATRVRHKFLN